MNDRRSNEGNTAQFSQACHEDGHDPMVDNVRTWKRYFRCRYCGHALDSDEERRQAAEALGAALTERGEMPAEYIPPN